MLSSAVTPVCMVRSTLRNKLFSENKPAGIVHPAERNALKRPQSNLSVFRRGF